MGKDGGRCLLVVCRRPLGDAAGGLGVRLLLPEERLHVAAPRHGSGDRSAGEKVGLRYLGGGVL
jgi:hypothetical protein